jgi:phenylacetate-coenzyme A ligase PaaK-like adenylate-forming protein
VTDSATELAPETTPETADSPLLVVEDVATHFVTDRGLVRAVDGVSFSLDRGTTLARLEVQVEPSPELVARCGGFSAEHPEIVTLRRRAAERLQRAIGLSVELTIVAPRTIPRAEGKAVRVVERG